MPVLRWLHCCWLCPLVGGLAPLYLLQVGIGRCDPCIIMVTMSALAVFTFLIEDLSPLYLGSWLRATGLIVVTAFLLLDVVARQW